MFRGNATSLSLNVMIFKLCDREVTGLSKFIHCKINFDVTEREKTTKTSQLIVSRFLSEYIY